MTPAHIRQFTVLVRLGAREKAWEFLKKHYNEELMTIQWNSTTRTEYPFSLVCRVLTITPSQDILQCMVNGIRHDT